MPRFNYPVTNPSEYYKDGNFTFQVPYGYAIESISMFNTTTNTATLSIGTTAGGSEVVAELEIAGTGSNNGVTNLRVDAGFMPKSTRKYETRMTTIYVHDRGGSWNSAKIKFRVHLKSL